MPSKDPLLRGVPIRPNRAIAHALQARTRDGTTTRYAVAKRDLERYYATVADELADLRVRRPLTPDQAAALCDALRPPRLNGWRDLPANAALVAAVRAARATGDLAIDGGDLVALARALSPMQAVALIDACERFWQSPADPGALEAAGLLEPATPTPTTTKTKGKE